MSATHFDPSRYAPAPRAVAVLAETGPVASPAASTAEAPEIPAAPAGAPSPAIPAPVAAPAVPAPAVPGVDAPRFVGGALRAMEVPLTYPVEFAGRVWEAIPLCRPTAAEVGAYFEQLHAIGEGEWLHFPIYREADGTPVPSAVIDFLDPDDAEEVSRAAANFLPARLKRLQVMQSGTSSTP